MTAPKKRGATDDFCFSGLKLLTTSRYASREARRAAADSAKAGGFRYVARGKKTIASLASDARRHGESALEVFEDRRGGGVVSSLLSVDEAGRWRWLGKGL